MDNMLSGHDLILKFRNSTCAVALGRSVALFAL